MGVVGAGLGALSLWKLFGKSKYNFPPGPRPLPVIGNLHNLASNPRSYLAFHDMAENYGDIVMFYLGPYPTVLLSSADAIREAFIRNGMDYVDRPWLAPIDLISDGGKDIIGAPFCPRLQLQRKLAFVALRKYASGEALEDHVEGAFQAFCESVDEHGFFVPTPMGYLVAYNILASMTFGKKFSFDDPFLMEIMDMQTEFEKAFSSASTFVFLLPFMKYFPSKVLRIVRLFAKTLQDLLKTCLKQHIETYNPAGSETTRSTLAWIWLYLAAFPEVQKKAQDEIDKVIEGGKVTVTCRDQLPYVDAILHEVMRIMPVAPSGVPRQSNTDTKLAGYDIPKGTMVFSNTWTTHHDERCWEDPYAFKPERWLDENGQYVFQPNGFLPFGVGRRSCIGESFAKLEIHMITTMILQRYTLKPAPGRRIDLTLMETGVVRARDQDVIVEMRQ